jgi:hypothetical protein
MKLKAARNSGLGYCIPLVDAMLGGIKKRFGPLLEDLDCQLASAFHPRFRLFWLERYDPDMVPRVRMAMEAALEEALQAPEETDSRKDCSSDDGDESEDFFAEFSITRRSSVGSHCNKRKAQDLVTAWLDAPSKSKSKDTLYSLSSDATFLGEPALVDLFVKYNTPVPSSASVERLFSIGKDIFRAKRASLSDENFEMLLFMKGNIHLIAALEQAKKKK